VSTETTGSTSQPEQEQSDKLLLNIERLTELTVKKLLNGDRDKLLDASQHRLLTVVAMRCIKLWKELRADERGKKRLQKQLEQLEKESLKDED